MSVTTDQHRDWSWETDGALENAHYVETRQVAIKNGPSAGKEKLIFDFAVGDESISVWETTVLKSKFAAELKARGKDDFEPGETITITPTGTKTSANGTYRDFKVVFEHAAPKATTKQLLGQVEEEDASRQEERPQFIDDGIPFLPASGPWGY